MNYAIVDLQGFRANNNKFILKEIAILTSNNETQHFIIKPPYSYHIVDLKTKYTNEYLRKHHHGFKWSDGDTNFWVVINILKIYINNYSEIYVKGAEKKTWLQNILKFHNIIDLNKEISTSLKKLQGLHILESKRCSFEHNGCCALENVFFLKIFVEAILKDLKPEI